MFQSFVQVFVTLIMLVLRGAKIVFCTLCIFILVGPLFGDESIDPNKKINSKNIAMKSNKINPNEGKFNKDNAMKSPKKFIISNNNFVTQPPGKVASNVYDGLFKGSNKCEFQLVLFT